MQFFPRRDKPVEYAIGTAVKKSSKEDMEDEDQRQVVQSTVLDEVFKVMNQAMADEETKMEDKKDMMGEEGEMKKKDQTTYSTKTKTSTKKKTSSSTKTKKTKPSKKTSAKKPTRQSPAR